MSIIPYLLRDLAYDAYDPLSQLYDQNFGVGLLNDELFPSQPSLMGLSAPLRSGYLRSLRHLLPEDSGISSIKNEKDSFKVNLDVQQFKPEEINVKVAGDYIVVEGKHEEKQDKHGFVSRQFTRRYKLPNNIQQEAITSTISSDGVLSITAPKKVEAIEPGKSRSVPVVKTNQPAIKQQSKEQRTGNKIEKMET